MTELTRDHVGLSDTYASRRYFRKFEGIMQHMLDVAGVMEAEGNLNDDEVEILTRYAVKLTHTFKALGLKYLLAGRETGRFFGSLTMDNHDSGFPVAEELMTMANDAQQAEGPDGSDDPRRAESADEVAILPVSAALLRGTREGRSILGAERPAIAMDGQYRGRPASVSPALGDI